MQGEGFVMKNVWLVVLCLLWCAGAVAGEVAPKGDEPAGDAGKKAPDIDYSLVYLQVESSATDEIAKGFYNVLSNKNNAGNTFNYYAISKKSEADPEQGGFLCQVKIASTVSHKRTIPTGTASYWIITTSTCTCAVNVYAAKDGKWVKVGGGSLTLIAGYTVLEQLEWFICGKLVRLKGSSKPGVDDIDIKGTIENPLPFAIGSLRIIAPLAEPFEVDWKPVPVMTENIPSGGKGQFKVTVPQRLVSLRSNRVFARLLWDKAIVCGFTIIKDEAAK